jgi:hypothetical protein
MSRPRRAQGSAALAILVKSLRLQKFNQLALFIELTLRNAATDTTKSRNCLG